MWRSLKQWHQKKTSPAENWLCVTWWRWRMWLSFLLWTSRVISCSDISILLRVIFFSILLWTSAVFSYSLGTSLSSLDESHISLVNQKWKFSNSDVALRMIRNMITHFPTCCALDSEGKPVSWILTYASCAMGMLYTLPEHRGKGYAKAVISAMAKRLHAQDYPVYCFVEEENTISYNLFKSLGFTEDPSYRETWFGFNDINQA